MSALRATKTESVVLNAISGFEQGRAKFSGKPLLIVAVVAALVVSVNLIPKSVSTEAASYEVQPEMTIAKVCGVSLSEGQEVLGSTKRLKRVVIEETEFVVASSQKLGGLLQLKLKRSCDDKYFRVDAWSNKNQVFIAKVY